MENIFEFSEQNPNSVVELRDDSNYRTFLATMASDSRRQRDPVLLKFSLEPAGAPSRGVLPACRGALFSVGPFPGKIHLLQVDLVLLSCGSQIRKQ